MIVSDTLPLNKVVSTAVLVGLVILVASVASATYLKHFLMKHLEVQVSAAEVRGEEKVLKEERT
jgi:hypothetical protein